jgi:acyl dehydratase
MERLQVGQAVKVARSFTQADFDRFAALSGDDNPIHVDPEFAARTRFGRTVAHGMLLYGVVAAALGTHLPGPGTVQLDQELMFPVATPAGLPVTVELAVTAVDPDAHTATLTTCILHPTGDAGLEGHTLVHLRTPSTDPPTYQSTNLPIYRPTHLPAHEPSNFHLGQSTSTTRTFTVDDLAEYAGLTGDHNPAYRDGPAVPGPLLGGLFSYLLGTRLPGRGTNYLKQRLVFPAPAYPGEPLTATVEIVRVRPEKELVNLTTICTGAGGQVVCSGEALVLVRDLERES